MNIPEKFFRELTMHAFLGSAGDMICGVAIGASVFGDMPRKRQFGIAFAGFATAMALWLLQGYF